MMSDEELQMIDDWRFKNRVATRSDAVRRLCQIALLLDPSASNLAISVAELGRMHVRLNKENLEEIANYKDHDDAEIQRLVQQLIAAYGEDCMSIVHLADVLSKLIQQIIILTDSQELKNAYQHLLSSKSEVTEETLIDYRRYSED